MDFAPVLAGVEQVEAKAGVAPVLAAIQQNKTLVDFAPVIDAFRSEHDEYRGAHTRVDSAPLTWHLSSMRSEVRTPEWILPLSSQR